MKKKFFIVGLILCLLGICVLCKLDCEKESILLIPLFGFCVYNLFSYKKEKKMEKDNIINLALCAVSLFTVTIFLEILSVFNDIKGTILISIFFGILALVLQIILLVKLKGKNSVDGK